MCARERRVSRCRMRGVAVALGPLRRSAWPSVPPAPRYKRAIKKSARVRVCVIIMIVRNGVPRPPHSSPALAEHARPGFCYDSRSLIVRALSSMRMRLRRSTMLRRAAAARALPCWRRSRLGTADGEMRARAGGWVAAASQLGRRSERSSAVDGSSARWRARLSPKWESHGWMPRHFNRRTK